MQPSLIANSHIPLNALSLPPGAFPFPTPSRSNSLLIRSLAKIIVQPLLLYLSHVLSWTFLLTL